jgi:alpha-N-arabinofuranosidase
MKYAALLGTLLWTGVSLSFSACHQQVYDTPTFTSFTYTGHDARYEQPFDAERQYLNPIISGCAPDPSICRKGDDYYLANSSFVYYPGIPIWHSRDLVHWEPLGYALNRPEQLTLRDGLRISEGIYAPDIKYNPANDTFYLIVTGVGCGGNFFVKSSDPAAGWSDPIALPEVGGIDPSFLFDTDGRCYIVNNDAPATPAEYDGHRAIWIREFDPKTDRVCGEATVLVDKGVHPDEHPIWIEGPHLYHIGDTYYLMSAEGGTGDQHSEVVFTSTAPTGPFKPCAVNPILTQRTLPADRPFPITSAGHADLVEDASGQWWAVFLACCTYEGDQYYNTGRSTFLLPVEWRDGQPIILSEGAVIPTVQEKSNLTPSKRYLTGNGTYSESFEGKEALDSGWFFLRTPMQQWYKVCDAGLEITARPVCLNEKKQPSMLCRWIKNEQFVAETSVLYTPQSNKSFAGLVCFQNEQAYFAVGKSLNPEGNPCVKLFSSTKEGTQLVASVDLSERVGDKPLYLRVEADGSAYQFYYALRPAEWRPIGDIQNGRILSTHYAGGFTGAVLGLYASSANE